MRIHCNLVIKNEIDVVEECLSAAIEWSDFIYVFDNGSTDGTWEKVRQLSSRHRQIVPFETRDCLYHKGLRGYVYNHFKKRSEPGDWWCKLDADEIYVDNPRTFLEAVKDPYKSVWSTSFQYYFTNSDLARYTDKPKSYGTEVPLGERYKYYMNNWSEMRFVKHTRKMVWDEGAAWPVTIYPVCPRRIRIKHYQFRSPEQMQKRIESRREAILRGTGFRHEARDDWASGVVLRRGTASAAGTRRIPTSWQERVVDEKQLYCETEPNALVEREDLLPRLCTSWFDARVKQARRSVKHCLKRVLGAVGRSSERVLASTSSRG